MNYQPVTILYPDGRQRATVVAPERVDNVAYAVEKLRTGYIAFVAPENAVKVYARIGGSERNDSSN